MVFGNLKRLLNKRSLKSQPKPIRRKPTNLGIAKWVGIIFDATLSERVEEVQQFVQQLEKEGKKVKLLGFVNSKKKEPNQGFPCFNRHNLSWIKVPSGKEVEDFVTQSFDVLFVLHPQSSLPFEYISTLTDAKLKVGPITQDVKSYDLMVDVSRRLPLSRFIEQVAFFAGKVKAPKIVKKISGVAA